MVIQGRLDSAFIFVAHHAIADGLSGAYAIRDALAALAGDSLEMLPLPRSQDETMSDHPVPRMDGGAPTWEPKSFASRGSRPKVRGLKLPVQLTTRIREVARKEQSTVHGALVAALVLAGRDISEDWQGELLRILSPINTRKLLKQDESVGLFVGAAMSLFDKSEMSFWELARRAKSDVAGVNSRDGLAAAFQTFQQVVSNGASVATAAEFASLAFANEALLTNLGALPFGNKIGALEIKALWGPAVHSNLEGAQTIGVATINGSIHLTHTSHAPLPDLLPAMQNVLASISVA